MGVETIGEKLHLYHCDTYTVGCRRRCVAWRRVGNLLNSHSNCRDGVGAAVTGTDPLQGGAPRINWVKELRNLYAYPLNPITDPLGHGTGSEAGTKIVIHIIIRAVD